MSSDRLDRKAMNRRRARLVWVRLLRWALPLAAVALALFAAAQVALREYKVLNTHTPMVREASVRMINPEFSGQGRDGKRYLVTASSAVRDDVDPLLFRLDQPTVVVRRGNELGARTIAKRGVFSQKDLILRLEGDVRTQQGGGDRYLADNAAIDTTTGAITGTGFRGSRLAGDVRADSYSVDAGRMVFKGGVRTKINAR